MKKRYYILSLFIIALIVGSCTVDSNVDNIAGMEKTKGKITVNMLLRDVNQHYQIYTARFIVFDNVSIAPKVDVNTLIHIPSGQQDADTYSTSLSVNINPDKTVIAVINEPEAATPKLGNVTTPSDLGKIHYLMADVFNENHTAPLLMGIPMTGIKTDIAVETGNTAVITMNVERAVARVDLRLKTNGSVSGQITDHTSVTLSRTHSEGNLMGPDEKTIHNQMLTVSNPSGEVTWNYTSSTPITLNTDAKDICFFYTPERTCSGENDSDKLILNLNKIKIGNSEKDAQIVLTGFAPEGGGAIQPMTEIRRNNVYRITGRLENSIVLFEQTVTPWVDEVVGVIADPQYYLRVSRDHLIITNPGEPAAITAETNYDRKGDRDFPAGVLVTIIHYYDKDGTILSEDNGNLYGWLNISLSDPLGSLSQRVTFEATGDLVKDKAGYYVEVEIKAGNIIKKVRITRS